MAFYFVFAQWFFEICSPDVGGILVQMPLRIAYGFEELLSI